MAKTPSSTTKARLSATKATSSAPKTRSSGTKARFFYALRPDPAAASELAALAARVAARWGGHAFAADDIHLTLAFVGMRPLEEQPALEAILAGLPSRFDVADEARAAKSIEASREDIAQAPPLALSRLGSFGRGVLWIGPGTRTDATSPARTFAHRLADDVRERLRAAQIDFDDRPLKLHATLVRGARAFDRRASTDAPDAAAGHAPIAAQAIIAHAWSLTLGVSVADSSAQQRYRWSSPATTRTESA